MIGCGIYNMTKDEYSRRASKELCNLTHDWFIGKNPDVGHNQLYMDLHFHFDKPKDVNGLENIISETMRRVDVIAVTGRGKKEEKEGVGNVVSAKGKRELMTYDDLAESLFLIRKKYKTQNMGRCLAIEKHGKTLYVIKGQEIVSEEGREVLALGCEEDFYEKQGTIKTAKDINDHKGISAICHPYTISIKKFPRFRIANEKEEEELKEYCKYVDCIDIFNSDNTLWMYKSNVKAKMFSEKHRIPGIAVTDGHGLLYQVGTSGIIVDKYNVDLSSGDVFIDSLRNVIRHKEFKTHTEYTGPITFIKSHKDMVKGIVNKVLRRR